MFLSLSQICFVVFLHGKRHIVQLKTSNIRFFVKILFPLIVCSSETICILFCILNRLLVAHSDYLEFSSNENKRPNGDFSWFSSLSLSFPCIVQALVSNICEYTVAVFFFVIFYSAVFARRSRCGTPRHIMAYTRCDILCSYY